MLLLPGHHLGNPLGSLEPIALLVLLKTKRALSTPGSLLGPGGQGLGLELLGQGLGRRLGGPLGGGKSLSGPSLGHISLEGASLLGLAPQTVLANFAGTTNALGGLPGTSGHL